MESFPFVKSSAFRNAVFQRECVIDTSLQISGFDCKGLPFIETVFIPGFETVFFKAIESDGSSDWRNTRPNRGEAREPR
jgi:hypothetical protein